MKTMEEQLISFDTAKLAKEKGFNAPCRFIMREGDSSFPENLFKCNGMHTNINSNCAKNDYMIPTQSLLQKWLRKEHRIDVLVMVYAGCEIQYGYCLYTNTISGHKEHITDPTKNGWSYEEALEAGLTEALKLIILT